MRIGFFTDHPVRTSETFILELISGLERELGSDALIHIAGNKEGKKVVENTYFGDFGEKKSYYKLVQNLERGLGLKGNSTFDLRRKKAEDALKQVPQRFTPDIAYFEFGQPAVLFRRILEQRNIPMVVHFHGMDASSAFNSEAYRQEIQEVFRYASRIITASHHIKRLLVLKGCSPDKISVIRYGVRVSEIQPKSWDQRTKYPSLIFLGRLTEKKNPLALVHAFYLVKQTVENARLDIVGDGPMREAVSNLIDKLNLRDSVVMHGELPHQEAMEKLSHHWAFAQHSVTASNGDQEGYALSPAEAAAYELPVVSTLHNGIPEHVIDGVTGYLVREFDYETMAEKIIEVLQDRELAIKMGQNGRRNILELNDPEKRIESVKGLLQLVLENRHNSNA